MPQRTAHAASARDSAKSVAPRKIPYLRCVRAGSTFAGEGPDVNPSGAYYSPEIIQLMRSVLEDAAASLPEAKRTSAIKAEMACYIPKCCARWPSAAWSTARIIPTTCRRNAERCEHPTDTAEDQPEWLAQL